MTTRVTRRKSESEIGSLKWRLTGGTMRSPSPVLLYQRRHPACTNSQGARKNDQQNRQ